MQTTVNIRSISNGFLVTTSKYDETSVYNDYDGPTAYIPPSEVFAGSPGEVGAAVIAALGDGGSSS
jgi:hypothetical protein